MQNKTIPAIVLGGSGYVAAEILGLLFNHPSFFVETIISASNSGLRVDETFPHLTGAAGDHTFQTIESAMPRLQGKRQLAVFSAMPHGETAAIFGKLFGQDTSAHVVDVSADFRHSAETYAKVYGKPHEASELLKKFTCALPDILQETPDQFIAHPGCFATGITLPLAPLYKAGLIQPHVCVSAVTGSTGAGRQPGAGTHHPHRQSSMWAYQPLVHRHTPEVLAQVGAFNPDATLSFVPHSGPFARGIHSTIFATLKGGASAQSVVDEISEFYANSPFIRASTKLPTLKEVVGSNRCHIGVAVEGDQLVVTSVIDNLVKGAAGGAVQWMNRMLGLDAHQGLMNAIPGWI